MAICAGNSPVHGEFPAQRPVTRRFDLFFNLCLDKRLSKQSWGWWFETLSRPLWRHCNEKDTPVAPSEWYRLANTIIQRSIPNWPIFDIFMQIQSSTMCL